MRKKIIFWLPQGRLGNLIFQYQAALSLFTENCIIVSLASEFSNTFVYPKYVKFVPIPFFMRQRVAHYLIKIFKWLSRNNIFCSLTPKLNSTNDYGLETLDLQRKEQGFFSHFWIIDGFFQHDRYTRTLPVIKLNILNRAEDILSKVPQSSRIAVHLRFGDYEKWTVLGKQGVCLPVEYYQSAMNKLANEIDSPVFIIFSDDKEKACQVIGHSYKSIFFSGCSSSVDIAGISICNHAIISASTFSWWGAYLIKNPEKMIIAPRYWAGYKSGVWFPADIETDKFNYIDVQEMQSKVL